MCSFLGLFYLSAMFALFCLFVGWLVGLLVEFGLVCLFLCFFDLVGWLVIAVVVVIVIVLLLFLLLLLVVVVVTFQSALVLAYVFASNIYIYIPVVPHKAVAEVSK